MVASQKWLVIAFSNISKKLALSHLVAGPAQQVGLAAQDQNNFNSTSTRNQKLVLVRYFSAKVPKSQFLLSLSRTSPLLTGRLLERLLLVCLLANMAKS